MWIGINANWFDGGETFINNKSSGSAQDNWRIGGTFSSPITKSQSLKFQLNAGAIQRAGLDYNTVSLSYQYIFF